MELDPVRSTSILIVDDGDELRRELTRYFDGPRYELRCATTAAQ